VQAAILPQGQLLKYDGQDGNFAIDEAELPNNMEALPKRIVKHVMHGLGVWP